MGDRRAREPRQRPHGLLRSADKASPEQSSTKSCSRMASACRETAIVFLRGKLDVRDQPLLFRRPENGSARDADRQPSGLSRQHQPRVGWLLLGGASRHADARPRPRAHHAGLSAAHGQACGAGTMALSQHQHRLRHQVRRSGPDRGQPLGSRRRQPSDDHLDARAQGLSLSRRRLQQPDRPLQDPRRRSELGGAGRLLG